jgi:hypothetical protein
MNQVPDALTTYNTVLAVQYVEWTAATADLERAALLRDAPLANVAYQRGSRAADLIGQMTGGNPEPAAAARWIEALQAWNAAAGMVVTTATPWWAYAVLAFYVFTLLSRRGNT